MSALAQFIQMYKEGKLRPSTMAKAAAFKEELEKKAGPDVTSYLKYLAAGLAFSAGMGIVAAGAKAGANAYGEYAMGIKKEELFKEILKLHPDLSGNKQRAMLYFEALIHFSPQVATNPLTAGAYIRQALQYDHVAGGPLPASINELAMIQKSTMDAGSKSSPSGLGLVLSGLAEGPTSMMPSAMSFKDFSYTPKISTESTE